MNSADYHDEINSEHFIEWFTQQLLPNIPPTSVIILDNASYHKQMDVDKPPTTVGNVAKHDKTHNLSEIEQLTPDRVTYTTTDMWRNFCRHVVDIENDYFERDKFFEDTTE